MINHSNVAKEHLSEKQSVSRSADDYNITFLFVFFSFCVCLENLGLFYCLSIIDVRTACVLL